MSDNDTSKQQMSEKGDIAQHQYTTSANSLSCYCVTVTDLVRRTNAVQQLCYRIILKLWSTEKVVTSPPPSFRRPLVDIGIGTVRLLQELCSKQRIRCIWSKYVCDTKQCSRGSSHNSFGAKTRGRIQLLGTGEQTTHNYRGEE